MKILLIIGGGIAAYKSLELIRLLREREAEVRAVLTEAGSSFVTPLSAAALSGGKVYRELLDYRSEADFSHIELARWADRIVIAPATANLIARIAGGHADDLATALLLASTSPISFAPAMNVQMWLKEATQANVRTLRSFGYSQFGPAEGPMACGEFGPGRMIEPKEIVRELFARDKRTDMAGRKALVTCGPTREAIDPVRFLSNRSSGKQGCAIAVELQRRGADVTLVAGPGVNARSGALKVIEVESAREMLDAVLATLPCDLFVGAAAVSDWRVSKVASGKIKKGKKQQELVLKFVKCPDILRTVARLESGRPDLVVGFAAETDDVVENARRKLAAKGCDWIVANDVGAGTGVFGGEHNTVTVIGRGGDARSWPRMTKQEVASALCGFLAGEFSDECAPN